MSPPADPAAPTKPRAPTSPFRQPPRWPLAFALLLVAAGIWELAADQLQRRSVATPADWRAADDHVRKHHKPGDLILTAPGWADPLTRLWLGDLMSLDDVTRPDSRTYRRIWQLSIRGAHHSELLGRDFTTKHHKTFGRVTVTLLEQTPVTVTADLYRDLARARVWEERGGTKHPCTWRPGRQRHNCGPGWKGVRQIRAEIGYTPRRCVLALPIEGATRVIEYPQVKLGRRLVLWTGLRGYDPRYRARRAVWEYQRFRAGKWRHKRPPRRVTSVPVTVEVRVDGQTVKRLQHPIEDEGWRRNVLEVTPSTAGKTAVVQLRIHTRHAWGKHFCFYARSEGGGR